MYFSFKILFSPPFGIPTLINFPFGCLGNALSPSLVIKILLWVSLPLLNIGGLYLLKRETEYL